MRVSVIVVVLCCEIGHATRAAGSAFRIVGPPLAATVCSPHRRADFATAPGLRARLPDGHRRCPRVVTRSAIDGRARPMVISMRLLERQNECLPAHAARMITSSVLREIEHFGKFLPRLGETVYRACSSLHQVYTQLARRRPKAPCPGSPNVRPPSDCALQHDTRHKHRASSRLATLQGRTNVDIAHRSRYHLEPRCHASRLHAIGDPVSFASPG